jgi:hypothetical protein
MADDVWSLGRCRIQTGRGGWSNDYHIRAHIIVDDHHLGAVISSWATWPLMDFSMMLC